MFDTFVFFCHTRSMKTLPKSWTTVTPFSKKLALVIFTLFPIFGFFLGRYYQKAVDKAEAPPPGVCMKPLSMPWLWLNLSEIFLIATSLKESCILSFVWWWLYGVWCLFCFLLHSFRCLASTWAHLRSSGRASGARSCFWIPSFIYTYMGILIRPYPNTSWCLPFLIMQDWPSCFFPNSLLLVFRGG